TKHRWVSGEHPYSSRYLRRIGRYWLSLVLAIILRSPSTAKGGLPSPSLRVVANPADAWSIIAYELDPAPAGLAHPFRRRACRPAARSHGGCAGRTSVGGSAGLHRSRHAACERLSAA